FFHDPAMADARAAGRKRGGRKKGVKLRLAETTQPQPADLPLATVHDVAVFLGQTIHEVRREEIDARVGNCLGVLCGTLIRAIEGGELARQIADMETELARLKQQGADPHDPGEEPLALATGEAADTPPVCPEADGG